MPSTTFGRGLAEQVRRSLRATRLSDIAAAGRALEARLRSGRGKRAEAGEPVSAKG
jgi:hypothetical protein